MVRCELIDVSMFCFQAIQALHGLPLRISNGIFLLAGAVNAWQNHKPPGAAQAARQPTNECALSKADFQRRAPPAAPKGAPVKKKSQQMLKKIAAGKNQKR